MDNYTEKRKYKRAPCETESVTFQGKDLAITVRGLKSVDISEGGLKLISPRCLITGQKLLVKLTLPEVDIEVEIYAEAIWCNPNHDVPGEFLVGLQFLSLSPHGKRL
jgi:c-di-GMP-binding flagellar brake protein YcgR